MLRNQNNYLQILVVIIILKTLRKYGGYSIFCSIGMFGTINY